MMDLASRGTKVSLDYLVQRGSVVKLACLALVFRDQMETLDLEVIQGSVAFQDNLAHRGLQVSDVGINLILDHSQESGSFRLLVVDLEIQVQIPARIWRSTDAFGPLSLSPNYFTGLLWG